MSSNTLQFFVFRHGETNWNVERRFQGHTDIPLNDRGREQAQALVEKFKQLNLEYMVSSDLCRAVETACIALAGAQIPMVQSAALRETRLGVPEGWLRDDIVKKYGADQWERWSSVHPDDHDFAFPEGETKREALARAKDFLENFAQQNPHLRRVGVATHGGLLRRLVHYAEGAPLDAVPIPNCCIYELNFMHQEARWTFAGPR